MKDTRIVDRYTNALINSLKKDELEAGLKELETTITAILSNEDIWELLQSPLTSAAEKQTLLSSVLNACHYSTISNFFILLIQKRRINLLPEILSRISAAVNNTKGLKLARIVTAQPTTDSAKKSITSALKLFCNADITAEYSLDDAIVGGFKATIGGMLLDASIKNTLDKLKTTLN
jgi:F-type H+-transporting ATPase subunit delta